MKCTLSELKWATAIYCMYYHNGQFSREYRIGSKLWKNSRNLPTLDKLLNDEEWEDLVPILERMIIKHSH